MTNTIDPVPSWTRQIAHLRRQALRAAPVVNPSHRDVTDNALHVCDGLLRDLAGLRLESERLEAELRSSDAAWEHLFDVMPVACLLTDGAGSIRNANRAAGVLFNLTARHLRNRELLVFSDDRKAFEALLRLLPRRGGEELRASITFRPRDRKPAAMDVVAAPLTDERSGLWLWFLTPARETHAAATPPAPDLLSA